MIFVDTSVWIDAYRGGVRAAPLADLLDRRAVALASIVRLEILGGASKATLPQLRRTLSALPTFAPSADTWTLLDRWIERTVAAGEQFGAADLVIAALASERGGQIWSLDADFARLAKLRLVRLWKPR